MFINITQNKIFRLLKNVMDLESLKNEFLEAVNNSSSETLHPAVLDDPRLENAFKTPAYDEEGRSENMPAISTSYSKYGFTDDCIKIISLPSATICTSLYSKYLDVPALVWDIAEKELLLYWPDTENPCIAFKGSRWACARKLKAEYAHLSIKDVYKELKAILAN